MSWICFHIENERLLKAAVSEEIRVECDKLFKQRGYEERGRWIPEKEVISSYIVEGVYYAAVRTTDRFGKSFVHAAIFPLCLQKRSIIICYVMNSMKESCHRSVSVQWKFYYCWVPRILHLLKSGEITVGIIIRRNTIRNIKRMWENNHQNIEKGKL